MAEKKRILIVEDDESLKKIMVHTLRAENLEVLEAGNGEEGLKMALEEKPDLVLLDIVLPGMDGLAVLKKLREDSRGKDIPVITLTNLGDIKTVSEAR